ncbi:MAG TPA: hypothetical protein VEL50_10510 [Gemmatimonadales bacterium]|nr:hypothetical protein [Gemmatimonadales bacterium]
MAWKANRTTTFAAVAGALAGIGRITFAHDYVLGGPLILVAVVIAIRSFLYYRKRNAQGP